jgi:hypothetical protein
MPEPEIQRPAAADDSEGVNVERSADTPFHQAQVQVLAVPFRPPRREPKLPPLRDTAMPPITDATIAELGLGRPSPVSVTRESAMGRLAAELELAAHPIAPVQANGSADSATSRDPVPSPQSGAAVHAEGSEHHIAVGGSGPFAPQAPTPSVPFTTAETEAALPDMLSLDDELVNPAAVLELRVVLARDAVPGFDLRILQGASQAANGSKLRVSRVTMRARQDVLQALAASVTGAAAALLRPTGHPSTGCKAEFGPPEWLLRAARHCMMPLVVVGGALGSGAVVGTSAAIHAVATATEGLLPCDLALPVVCDSDRQALHFVQDLGAELRGQSWFRSNAVGAAISQARLSWMRTRGSLLMCLQDGLAEPGLQVRLGAGEGATPLWVQAACLLAEDLGQVLPGGLARWGLGKLAVCSTKSSGPHHSSSAAAASASSSSGAPWLS